MNNPNYIPYSQQERHRIIDTVIETSVEALQIPEIEKRLGSRAIDLSNILQHTTVPNIQHGEIIPVHNQTDQTEMIALHSDEVVSRRYRDMSFNTTQEQTLVNNYGPKIANDIINVQKQYFDTDEDTMPLASFDQLGVAAHVFKATLPQQTNFGAMALKGRPLVVFNADRPNERSPSFALHELTHVLQLHRRPIIEPGEDGDQIHIEEELEAYHVSAQVIRGYQEAGRHVELQSSIDEAAQKWMLQIDDVRRSHQHNDTNPFEANDTVAAGLAAHHLSVTRIG
ncbi:MAG TPA: hypothetical protein VFM68_02150 [Candidatus Saccharimonadales bacterium]|nr:hypothetical protein [Candidatus Saccharimonadales bacterium]